MTHAQQAASAPQWYPVCHVSDLVAGAGVCVRLGQAQIALFYLPGDEKSIHAVGNWDPLGRANVLSRGILGDVGGQLVVASPLYKQHFVLESGQCLEDDSCTIPVYPARISEEQVWVIAD